MEHSTLEIIETLKEDGADSIASMLFALEDGAYLAKKPWAQEEIEEAHNLLKAIPHA